MNNGWKTLENGTHVLIKDGIIVEGPKNIKGMSIQQRLKKQLRKQPKFSEVKVGDTFEQEINGNTYKIEVTSRNGNDVTVQAKSVIANGKETSLFGSIWISKLVEKRTPTTPKGHISMSETKNWKKK